MPSFLHRIAQVFWEKKHEQVSNLTFVFPNRRAGLFFRKYLSQIAGKVIFSPSILTINQLFQQLSSLQLADNIDLLFRLYQAYQAERKSTESFDDFLFWGRMMLNDFNEVDQHLVDAKALFTNLQDLKALEERFAQLSQEEEASVQAFFQHMQEGNISQYKQQFFSLWNSLYPIYTRFRSELQHEGLAYMGMLQRHVCEQGIATQQHATQYIFIGFNALTGVEKELMMQLHKQGIADFYWDYESPWLQDKNNRASLFREDNIKHFPSQYTLPKVEKHTPTIHLTRIASSVGQADVIRHLLTTHNPQPTANSDWTRVGIVLPDENMLLPIRNAIPATVKHVNITMGQPLKQTALYALLVNCSELSILATQTQTQALYYKPILSLLHHPYIQAVAANEAENLQNTIIQGNWVYLSHQELTFYPFLQQLLHLPTSPKGVLTQLRELLLTLASNEHITDIDKEYLYQTLLIINRLERLLQHHASISMSIKTLYHLLLQWVESTAVPFEGEPLLGLQIMGVLESRSMDFDTLILTDANDETLPGRVQQNSYIPYDLRLYFGMPTTERQDAIFAYNFYRLIANASTVHLIQNTQSNDMRSGEVSRYVYQLQYQYDVPIQIHDISFIPAPQPRKPIAIHKSDEVLQQIHHVMTQRGISPSALNTYVGCPLRFYYQVIEGIRESEVVSEDIAANQLGTVLHTVMEQLYGNPERPYQVSETDINRMLKRVEQTPLVEEAYKQVFYKERTTTLTGRDLLAVHALRRYAKNILLHDKAYCPFFYHASEKRLEGTFTASNGHTVKIKGFIDRIDSKHEQVRVVDYKTSNPKNHNYKYDAPTLFAEETAGKADYFRQTLFYGLLYTLNHPKSDCGATIYYCRKQGETVANEQYASFQQMEGFQESLANVLADIYNPALPFCATHNDNVCKFCPFATICGK